MSRRQVAHRRRRASPRGTWHTPQRAPRWGACRRPAGSRCLARGTSDPSGAGSGKPACPSAQAHAASHSLRLRRRLVPRRGEQSFATSLKPCAAEFSSFLPCALCQPMGGIYVGNESGERGGGGGSRVARLGRDQEFLKIPGDVRLFHGAPDDVVLGVGDVRARVGAAPAMRREVLYVYEHTHSRQVLIPASGAIQHHPHRASLRNAREARRAPCATRHTRARREWVGSVCVSVSLYVRISRPRFLEFGSKY